jgi:hypothetical protein
MVLWGWIPLKIWITYLHFSVLYYINDGRDSSVGIATRNGLDFPGSNAGGGNIFHIRQDRPWGPPSFLYKGYRVSFQGVNRTGRDVDHATPSSAEVKERVGKYLYSPSGPSWPVLWFKIGLGMTHTGIVIENIKRIVTGFFMLRRQWLSFHNSTVLIWAGTPAIAKWGFSWIFAVLPSQIPGIRL